MTQNEKAARKKKIMHAIMWIVLLILFICFVAPFILVVINVFKTKGDITSNPLSLIGEHGFTLKNFPEAMKKMIREDNLRTSMAQAAQTNVERFRIERIAQQWKQLFTSL